jgi:VWFA-related protein
MSRWCSLVLLALIALVGNANSQTTPLNESEEPQHLRFSTKLDLVVLNATVRDRKGGFVPDLTQPDFKAYEDNVLQTIRLFRHEDIPVVVGLVVDHSGSMSTKLAEVVAAARTFVSASRSDDDMFVVNFNETVVLEGSDRPDQLANAISAWPTLGKTALYDAVIKGLAQLQTRPLPKKVLIVISDGGDNASRHNLAAVLALVEESNVLVYTIGIFDQDDPDKNRKVLMSLAHISGGESFFPQQFSEVVSICQSIAHDIRNQYTVGYVSSNAVQPGVFRSIRLQVRTPGMGKLMVRSRSGYIAGEAMK